MRMSTSTSRGTSMTSTFLLSTIFLLLSGFCIVLFHFVLIAPWLPFIGLLLIVVVVVVAARATMVACITVLVLLAFVGNRRRVLVKQGREITADVAMYLVGVVFRGRGLIAVALATILSLMAVAHSRETIDLSV